MVLMKNDVTGGSQNSALPLADGESVVLQVMKFKLQKQKRGKENI